MKRIVSNIPGFIVGVLFTVFCIFAVTQVSAVVATRISLAEYNDTTVMFDDVQINLTETPLVSISNEGNERFITNYMPLRTILEAMDYGVAWVDEWENRRVLIYSEQHLIESEEWLDLRVVEELPEGSGFGTMYFDAERNIVLVFSGRHTSYISTAVIGNSIFVERGGVNLFLSNRGVPPIPNSAEVATLEARENEYRENPTAFVAFDTLSEFIRQQDSSLGVVLSSVSHSNLVLRDGHSAMIYSGDDRSPTITHAEIPVIFIRDTPYVRRVELNQHLVGLGLTPME